MSQRPRGVIDEEPDRSHLAVFGERLGVERSAECHRYVGPADQRHRQGCDPSSKAGRKPNPSVLCGDTRSMSSDGIDTQVRGPLRTRKVPSSRQWGIHGDPGDVPEHPQQTVDGEDQDHYPTAGQGTSNRIRKCTTTDSRTVSGTRIHINRARSR